MTVQTGTVPIPRLAPPADCRLLKPVRSPMVRLPEGGKLDVRMQYPLLGMQNAVDVCYVRTEVRDMLLQAQASLPPGFRLRVWDAWRPLALQKELYIKYSAQITEQLSLQNFPEAERNKIVRRYVSWPSEDRRFPPVHTTGGAVDVTLTDPDGNELDLGTGFDAFTERTHTAWYEKAGNSDIRMRRRILYHAMTGAGFCNLESEWWHYDFGDRFWAAERNCPAMYEGIFTRKEVEEYET